MRFGEAASQQLQQFGQQLRNDLTTIQTNQQLQGFAQSLPNDVNPNSNPDFYSQINSAASQYPLAAHSPVGMSILNQLGKAHSDAMQTLLLGQKLNTQQAIATGHDITRENVAQTGAQSRENVAGTRLSGVMAGLDSKQNLFTQAEEGRNQRAGIKVIGNHVVDLNQSDEDGNPKILYTGKEKPVLKDVGGTLVDASDPGNVKEIFQSQPKSVTPNKTEDLKTKLIDAEAENKKNEALWENSRAELMKPDANPDQKAKDQHAKFEAAYRQSQAKVMGLRGQLGALGQTQKIDKATAKKFFEQANGDIDKAKELAKQAGYAF